MYSVVLKHEVDWEGFRTAARKLALARIAPEHVFWAVDERADLFAEQPLPDSSGTLTLPRGLVHLCQQVIQARQSARFDILYRLIWRATFLQDRRVLERITDPDVSRANRLAHSVRRDTHKMRAFIRFREVQDISITRHVAWFEPQHFIVEANAQFFLKRFTGMTWSILTPYRCAHWDGNTVFFTDGAREADVPRDDDLAAYWKVYFSSIFNPARLKPNAMRTEMPKKYWRNLPEAAAIPELVAGAAARTQSMINTPTLSPPRPTKRR